jgi:hypothetical protein
MSDSSHHQDHTTTGEPNPSTADIPFRFLALPAQLRLKVYGFACYEDRRIDLFNVKIPAITRVSRLVRHEALAAFFEINYFLVAIYTPYQISGHRNEIGRFLPANHERNDLFGTLRISGLTSNALNTLGAAKAKFRRMDIWLWCAVQANEDWMRGGVAVRLTNRMPNSVKMLSPRGRYTIQDIDKDYFLQPLHQAVKEHVEKNRSGGIALKDLQSMAQTVNLPPGDHPRVAERVVWTGEDAVLEYGMELDYSENHWRSASIEFELWVRSERRWGRR